MPAVVVGEVVVATDVVSILTLLVGDDVIDVVVVPVVVLNVVVSVVVVLADVVGDVVVESDVDSVVVVVCDVDVVRVVRAHSSIPSFSMTYSSTSLMASATFAQSEGITTRKPSTVHVMLTALNTSPSVAVIRALATLVHVSLLFSCNNPIAELQRILGTKLSLEHSLVTC